MEYKVFLDHFKQDQKAILLDVRTEEEFKTGTLQGAENLDYLSQTLADELEQLPKEISYYVFCRTGRRSLRVCVLLKNMGYKVINLDGGLSSIN